MIINGKKIKFNSYLHTYDINNNLIIFYDYKYEQGYVGVDGKYKVDKIKVGVKITKLRKLNETFNLSDPIEKQLARIDGFYEVLMHIEDDGLQILFESAYYDNIEDKNEVSTKEFDWFGMEDMGSFNVIYDYEEEHNYRKDKDCILVRYSEYQYGEHIQGLEKGDEDNRYECYSKEEFNLLMQIYYGVYDDEKLKKELEEKEKKGEFNKIKKYINREEMRKILKKELKLEEKEKKLLEDYLKLELMKKPIDGAFPELKIRKIYDKNWNEEEQKKVVEKINNELGKEVVVLEE